MAKNLGTLTLDIIAQTGGFVQGMSKAERASDKWRKQVEKDLKTIGKGVGTAVGAATAAVIGMTASTLNAAKEVERLSAVSGIGQEDFQRYAAGAKAVGIEQDKLADIFKDTNDKIGDFMQTGAGPLADFFEQIAPKVGVTVDSFRELSGPQGLELYVSSLEKAGVSQAEMTFYMEAIASDATALLPLLRNNAKGFKELGDQAEAAGAILSGDTLESSRQLNAAMFVMEQQFAGIKNQASAELIPVLADLAGQFSEVSVDGSIAAEIAEKVGLAIKGAAATAVGAYSAFQLVGKTLAGMAAVIAAVPDGLDAVRVAQDVVNEDLNRTADEAASAIKRIMDAGSESSQASEQIRKIAGYMDAAASTGGSAAGSFRAVSEESKKAADDARKLQESIEGELTALERAAAVWGMNADEVKLYDLAMQGANDTQLDQARALLDTVSAMERQKEAQESYLSLVSDLRTEEEQRTDTLRKQLAVIEAMAGLPTGERSEQISRAAAGAFTDAPDFGGLAPEVGGAGGEVRKANEAAIELEKWYSEQLSMLEQFREERADLNAEWDEQELALKQEHESRLLEIERARNYASLQVASEVFGNLESLSNSENKKLVAISKAAATAQAVVSGAQAFMNALAIPPYPLGVALAATSAIATATQIATINGVGFRDGGYTGNGGINEVAGFVHGREYVMPADATARIGVAALDAMASGASADIRASRDGSSGRARGGVVVNQTINTTGRIDARTSNQMANDTARKQRTAQARLG